MRIETTLAKSAPLPTDALEALSKELHMRIDTWFSNSQLQVRYASANGITILGGSKEDKVLILTIDLTSTLYNKILLYCRLPGSLPDFSFPFCQNTPAFAVKISNTAYDRE